MSAADELAALMDDRGRLNYGENVTTAEHSLLTAAAAEQQGHHDTLVAACLMHDVGHWLDEPDDGYGIHAPRAPCRARGAGPPLPPASSRCS